MIIKIPSLAAVEKKIAIPASEWHGRCFEIASRIVDANLVKGVAVYGHWRGHVSTAGYWKARASHGLPFIQHGWIKLKDGRVLDPTRFSFENKKPYLFVGDEGPEYDEGGNQFRSQFRSPPPDFDPTAPQVALEGLSAGAEHFIRDAVDRQNGPLSLRQMIWIANTPPKTMGAQANEIYDWIKRIGHVAAIPYDNRKMVDESRHV